MRTERARGVPDPVYWAAGAVLAVVVWQVASMVVDSSRTLPSPGSVLVSLVEELGSASFWTATGITLWIAFRAFLVAVVVGVLVGLLAGSVRWIGAILTVPIDFLRPIPPIVILPLTVLAVGPTARMADILVFYGCVLPIVYQTTAGVRETDPVTLDTGRSYGMGPVERMVRIILPSALAFIGTAIRIAVPISLIVVVVAGLIGGGPGLGYELYRAMNAGDQSRLFGLVVALGVMGLIAQAAVVQLERYFLHWHPSQRARRGIS